MARFNLKTLEWYCTASIEEIFDRMGGTIQEGMSGRHMHIDNGTEVLAVAHLDIAPGIQKLQKRFLSVGKHWVFSVALDDRLGAYLICDFLPRLGLKYDVLLTENEEIGMSTAADYQPKKGKEYNWLFQFDRNGGDVVMYEYEDHARRTLLTDSGFVVGFGSFSDICYLEHLECKGFNFGTGYAREHTKTCNANLKITAKMIDLFAAFFSANQEITMVHEPLEWTYEEYLPYSDKWDDAPHHYPNALYMEPKKFKYYGAWGNEKPTDGGDWTNDWEQADHENENQLLAAGETALMRRINQEMKAVYGCSIYDMDWDDYCLVMGISPTDSATWNNEDWRVWHEIGE